MKHKKELVLSIILFSLGIVTQQIANLLTSTQLNDGYINPTIISGISLSFLIASMSFNIRLIRNFSTPKRISKRSRVLMVLSTIYLVVIYCF